MNTLTKLLVSLTRVLCEGFDLLLQLEYSVLQQLNVKLVFSLSPYFQCHVRYHFPLLFSLHGARRPSAFAEIVLLQIFGVIV